MGLEEDGSRWSNGEISSGCRYGLLKVPRAKEKKLILQSRLLLIVLAECGGLGGSYGVKQVARESF
jgi:hypothetical protein